MNVHDSALEYLAREVLPAVPSLNGHLQQLASGTRLLDFGCQALGGQRAGVAMAELCLAGLAQVSIAPGGFTGQQVVVQTDQPLQACMASQYAGWPISVDQFFSMGSGPIRAARGKEKMLQELELTVPAEQSIAILETSRLPDDSVACAIASEAQIEPAALTLVAARTASLAGTIQIVARSVETSLHKLHELGFDLRQVESGFGTAPLPPVPSKDLQAMGWTNDAVLYGGRVTLWVRCEDDQLASLVNQVPSQASNDFGRPFLEIFEQYERDFYKIDPHLFSPAQVTLVNRASGRVFSAGGVHESVLRESFRWPH